MHWRAVAALTLVVAILAALVVVRRQEGEPRSAELFVPLLSGLERTRITSVRIDNSERGVQVRLERDSGGRWFVTDPVAYPANVSVVAALIEVLTTNQALPVERDAVEVQLDPARVTLAVLEEVDGAERRYELELGAVDLGNQDVYVRVDGRILLTRRNLEGSLIHNVDHYRSNTVSELSARRITEFHRRGRLPEGAPDAGRDLTMSAQLTGGGWQQDRPWSVRLDPASLQLVLQVACGLRVQEFMDDAPLDRLGLYGLDEPAFEVELLGESSQVDVLQFGVADAAAAERGEWMCMRKGYPHVFRVEERAALSLATDQAELFDYRIVRAQRDTIESVEFTSDARRLVLDKDEVGWRVRAYVAGELVPGRPDERADAARVEDLLGELEAAEILGFDAAAPFAAGKDSGSVRLTTRAGVEWGGRFGAPTTFAGEAGRQFQRSGDDVVGVVPEELWSPEVHDLDVLIQARVEISGFGRTVRFVRDEKRGLWFTEGGGAEAPEDFTAYWLDPLLHLRSLAWVDGATELLDPIEVTFVDKSGHHRFGRASVTFGRTPLAASDERAALGADGGRVECQSRAGRSESRADVYAALRELLTGP